MSEEAGGRATVADDGTTGDDVATGGITWADIYESPQVERSLRRLPRLCREAVQLVWAAGRHELLVVLAIKAVNGIGLAVVLLLGKGVLDGVIAAGRSDAGAETVLPSLLLLTVVVAGLGFLSALGREHREILAELASRHAQSQIIDVACAVKLEAYDTPAFHDRLVRAARGRPVPALAGRGGADRPGRGRDRHRRHPGPARPPALAGAAGPVRGRAPADRRGQGRRPDVRVPPPHDPGRAPPQLPLHAAVGQGRGQGAARLRPG
jgi:hypothetical protein